VQIREVQIREVQIREVQIREVHKDWVDWDRRLQGLR